MNNHLSKLNLTRDGTMKYKIKLLLLASFSMISVTNLSYAEESTPPTPVGKVVWLQGTLKAVMKNNELRLLQKSSIIYANDTLETDHDSKAQIVFTDNTLLTFRPDTEFHIDQYKFNKNEKKGSGTYVMNLIKGGFRTITGLIAKENPDNYKVKTPVATIGVRGTEYNAYFDHGELQLGYIKGMPCLFNQGGALCLGDKLRYAQAKSPNVTPQPLTTMPAVFKEELKIVPAKASFATTTSTEGSSTTSRAPRGGVYSSFCITK